MVEFVSINYWNIYGHILYSTKVRLHLPYAYLFKLLAI